MKNKHIYACLIILLIFLLLFLSIMPFNENALEADSKTEEEWLGFEKAAVTKLQKNIIYSETSLPLHAADCRKETKYYDKAMKSWKASLPALLGQLKQNYGHDYTLKALIAATGKSYAYELHLGLKREEIKESLQKVNHLALSEMLKRELGDQAFEGSEINWSKIPKEVLMDISKFRPEHVERMLNVGADNLPYDEIFEKVIDISRDFNGPRISNRYPDNILEKLVLDNEPKLIELYFKRGGLAKDELMGINALEKLIWNVPLEELSLYSEVISMLTKKGLSVRYRKNMKKQVEIGQFFETFKRSDQDRYESLGFNFELAETEESIKENPMYHNLKVQLLNDRDILFKQEFNLKSSEFYAQCEEVLNLVNERISNSENTELVKRIINQHADNIGLLNEKLFELEPGLTDCAMKDSLNPPEIKETEKSDPRYDQINKLTRAHSEHDIHVVISEFLKLKPTKSEKSYFFWKVVEPRNVAFLNESGLLPESFFLQDLYRADFRVIEALIEIGYDFNAPSDTERNLVEGAASVCNSRLIEWMVQEGFAYQFSSIRSDALAIGIRNTCFGNHKRKMDLISAIMQFKPMIKDYHRQRMAEVRLQDYEMYNKLIEKHPQLKISEEQNPSGYYCRVVRHSTDMFISY